jgi:hypothetical protein
VLDPGAEADPGWLAVGHGVMLRHPDRGGNNEGNIVLMMSVSADGFIEGRTATSAGTGSTTSSTGT